MNQQLKQRKHHHQGRECFTSSSEESLSSAAAASSESASEPEPSPLSSNDSDSCSPRGTPQNLLKNRTPQPKRIRDKRRQKFSDLVIVLGPYTVAPRGVVGGEVVAPCSRSPSPWPIFDAGRLRVLPHCSCVGEEESGGGGRGGGGSGAVVVRTATLAVTIYMPSKCDSMPPQKRALFIFFLSPTLFSARRRSKQCALKPHGSALRCRNG